MSPSQWGQRPPDVPRAGRAITGSAELEGVGIELELNGYLNREEELPGLSPGIRSPLLMDGNRGRLQVTEGGWSTLSTCHEKREDSLSDELDLDLRHREDREPDRPG